MKPYSDSWDDPNYAEIFTVFESIDLIKKNKELHDLTMVFYYCINSLSANVDPGECNRIIEILAKKGKLHLVQHYSSDALDFLYSHDSEYFYARFEEHIFFCKDKYPDRINVLEKKEYYKEWLELQE